MGWWCAARAAARTLQAGAGISVSNGDGASANPTISLAAGAALTNLGYTPANKAGDAFTGPVSFAASTPPIVANPTSSAFAISLKLNGAQTGHIYSDATNFILQSAGALNAMIMAWASGNAAFAGTVTEMSDVRLKRDVRPLADSYEAIMALRGVRFEWADVADRCRRGLIAQEVRPEYVQTGADGLKSVAYGNIVIDLINAFQELARRTQSET